MATSADIDSVEELLRHAYPADGIPAELDEKLIPSQADPLAFSKLTVLLDSNHPARAILLTDKRYTGDNLFRHKTVGPYLRATLQQKRSSRWWNRKRERYLESQRKREKKRLETMSSQGSNNNNNISWFGVLAGAPSAATAPSTPSRRQPAAALRMMTLEQWLRQQELDQRQQELDITKEYLSSHIENSKDLVGLENKRLDIFKDNMDKMIRSGDTTRDKIFESGRKTRDVVEALVSSKQSEFNLPLFVFRRRCLKANAFSHFRFISCL